MWEQSGCALRVRPEKVGPSDPPHRSGASLQNNGAKRTTEGGKGVRASPAFQRCRPDNTEQPLLSVSPPGRDQKVCVRVCACVSVRARSVSPSSLAL